LTWISEKPEGIVRNGTLFKNCRCINSRLAAFDVAADRVFLTGRCGPSRSILTAVVIGRRHVLAV
jgi:hypothetical protein